MILLLDAANTIIYKPNFYSKFIEVLGNYNLVVENEDLKKIHKITSEYYNFPDRTSKEFYLKFNSELLYGLGIIPSPEMLEDIYKACSYLEWEKFEDTKYLSQINCKKVILSNFNNGLNSILERHFSGMFTSIITSELEGVRKPDPQFFNIAIESVGVKPSEILYVGDSIKLDLEPGINAGMNAWLLDRENYYPYCKRRLSTLKELINLF